MSTGIEWTDETWNPVTGCTKVSPGCDHCYAETITERFHGKGSFEIVELHPERLEKPLHWKKPRRVFVNSMSDLFHKDVPDEFILQVFATMSMAQQHTFQVLTKRAGRMRSLMQRFMDEERAWGVGGRVPFPLPNVWLGVSVEDHKWAKVRVPKLIETPAAVRFLSCEPLLGEVYLADMRWGGDEGRDPEGELRWGSLDALRGTHHIDWVIVGGESGHGARPMDPDWARSLRDQCVDADVAFFFKQWGAWRPNVAYDDDRMVEVGKKRAGRDLDGRTWDEMPEVAA